MISAKIIADSINPSGDRITSFVLKFPRYILAEFNTHRAFSRNSASSRAVPFAKMVKMVEENPFIPIKWMKDHSGMQGTEYLEDEERLKSHWLIARDKAVGQAMMLNGCGVTKQLCNRLLEPFMWHTAIVTATEYDNFFFLRNTEGADIHFKELARLMLLAMNENTPKELNIGEWHIPFGENIDLSRLPNDDCDEERLKIMIATARCARVSYINYDGKDDYIADLQLFKKLSESGQMSPFEHCAQADESEFFGNFNGWKQLRKLIIDENHSIYNELKRF